MTTDIKYTVPIQTHRGIKYETKTGTRVHAELRGIKIPLALQSDGFFVHLPSGQTLRSLEELKKLYTTQNPVYHLCSNKAYIEWFLESKVAAHGLEKVMAQFNEAEVLNPEFKE